MGGSHLVVNGRWKNEAWLFGVDVSGVPSYWNRVPARPLSKGVTPPGRILSAVVVLSASAPRMT